MSLRDFLLLVSVCLVWGANFIVAKFVITGEPGWLPGYEGAPPIFFAFLRFALLYAFLAPWLRPRPPNMVEVFWLAMTMGAVHFGLLFLGLMWATPSGMAIALQTGVPFATILSVIFLKERIGWIRGAGIVIAIAGAALVIANPSNIDLSLGLLIGVGAAFAGSAGMILVKRVNMDVLPMQAWIGLFSAPPLLVMSLLVETDQVARFVAGGWPILACLVFTVAVVNIYGHGMFYILLKKYDATLISPLTLMAPLVGVIGGVVVMGDPFGVREIIGGLLTLAGVGVIASRPNKKLPEAALVREKAL